MNSDEKILWFIFGALCAFAFFPEDERETHTRVKNLRERLYPGKNPDAANYARDRKRILGDFKRTHNNLIPNG